MIVLALGRFGSPHSRVLTHVRRAGLVTREDLARRTGLSASTVARTLTGLCEAGLAVERPDQLSERSPGRPSIPVQIATRHFATLGVHVGRRMTTLSLGDLRGQVLRRRHIETPERAADLAVAANRAFTALLAEEPQRVVVGTGLVGPWGEVPHDEDVLADLLERALGLPVTVGEMIPALVAAEYLARDEDLPGSTLYVYSRDTVGFAMANQRPAGMEITRVGRLSHFPIGGTEVCRCGRTGCLAAAVSNDTLLAATRLAAGSGGAAMDLGTAHDLLIARAEVLGQVVGIVTDMMHPDRVVLCGQGFTDYPPALEVIRRSFAGHTVSSGDLDLEFTPIGDVQAVAAGAVALRPVYDDPMAVADSLGLRRCHSG